MDQQVADDDGIAQRVRDTFAVHEDPVVGLSGAELVDTTAQERYRAWRRSQADRSAATEYLLPRIDRQISRTPAAFVPSPTEADRAAVATEVERLGPWRVLERLGPWRVPFDVGDGVITMPDSIERAVTWSRILYRRDLIVGCVTDILGEELADTSFVDLGCNSGFFSLDLAARGARRVDGIDLRSENVAQARFLADRYGLDNVRFAVDDVESTSGGCWDVVLNLGVLYHVVQPLQLLRRTYEQCRRFAVVDTVCHKEPVSAFFLLGDKDVGRPTEGREAYELHPTYRAVIDGLRYAGFGEVFELTGEADPPHDLYYGGTRRCFLAVR